MNTPQLIPLIILIVLHLSKQDTGFSVQRANEYIEANYQNVNQKYRYRYHAMAPIGWINDPNGFIQFRGEYHLFYQYNPYSSVWDTMHWGHVKSGDLVNWERLPVALAPDQEYDQDGIFSGTAIEIDEKLYVMYTCVNGTLQQQCVAYSEDGIDFVKVPQNPVIDVSQLPNNAQKEDFRDPKVFKRGDLYYVALASKTVNETGQILLYESDDFFNWNFKSILLEGTAEQGVMFECPDLFELDGKDVLILSAIEMPKVGNDYQNYDTVLAFVGSVNWNEGIFNVETTKEIDHGLDFYAPQTIRDDQGRRILIAWMQMWQRTYVTSVLGHGWNGGMTFPRELHLQDGYLVQTPVNAIQNYYANVAEVNNVSFVNSTIRFRAIDGEVGVLEINADLSEATIFNVQLRASVNNKTVLSYNVADQEIDLSRRESGFVITGVEEGELDHRKVNVPLVNGKLKLQIFLDKSSVEVFVNDGVESLTTLIYPLDDAAQLIIFEGRGRVLLESVKFAVINL